MTLLSSIEPLEPLKDALVEQGLTEAIYTGNKPTSALPNAYVELYVNGGTRTSMSMMGMVEGYVLVAINTRMLSTGAKNKVKERIILEKFDSLFRNNKSLAKQGYVYNLDTNNMIFEGGGLYEGYSTKIINLKYKK